MLANQVAVRSFLFYRLDYFCLTANVTENWRTNLKFRGEENISGHLTQYFKNNILNWFSKQHIVQKLSYVAKTNIIIVQFE